MTEAGVYVEGLALSFDWARDGERFLDSAGIDEAIEAFKANPVLAYSHSQRVAETVHGPSRSSGQASCSTPSVRPKTSELRRGFPGRPLADFSATSMT